MMFSMFVLALQAATTQPVALVTEGAVQQETAAEPVRAAQPKKVCRTVLDNRTGLIAKQRKVCRTVQDTEENGAN